jgi:hypothetical protein
VSKFCTLGHVPDWRKYSGGGGALFVLAQNHPRKAWLMLAVIIKTRFDGNVKRLTVILTPHPDVDHLFAPAVVLIFFCRIGKAIAAMRLKFSWGYR